MLIAYQWLYLIMITLCLSIINDYQWLYLTSLFNEFRVVGQQNRLYRMYVSVKFQELKYRNPIITTIWLKELRTLWAKMQETMTEKKRGKKERESFSYKILGGQHYIWNEVLTSINGMIFDNHAE